MIEGDVLPQKTKKAKKRYEQEAKVLPYENKKMWFVEFYVDWAPNCLHVTLCTYSGQGNMGGVLHEVHHRKAALCHR